MEFSGFSFKFLDSVAGLEKRFATARREQYGDTPAAQSKVALVELLDAVGGLAPVGRRIYWYSRSVGIVD